MDPQPLPCVRPGDPVPAALWLLRHSNSEGGAGLGASGSVLTEIEV